MEGGSGVVTQIVRGQDKMLMKRPKPTQGDSLGKFSVDKDRPTDGTYDVHLRKQGEAIGVYVRKDTKDNKGSNDPLDARQGLMSKHLVAAEHFLLKHEGADRSGLEDYHLVPNTAAGKSWIKTKLLEYGGEFAITGIVMPQAPGVDLLEAMKRKVDGAGNRLVQPKRLGQFCKSMVSALQQMSKHGIVHNDIKPQNVIYDPETGSAKLIDFGLAKKDIKHETASRYGGEVAGTEGFIPPSGLGKKEAGYERDIIAAGITVMCAAAAASSSSPAVKEMSTIINEFQDALGPDYDKAFGQFKLDDKTLKSRLGKLQKLVNKFDGINETDDEVKKAFGFGVDMIRKGTQAMLDRVNKGPEIGTYRYVPKQDTPWYTEHPLDKIAESANDIWNERPLNG
jgi:hypothetical protein